MNKCDSREYTLQMAYNEISPGGLERFDTLASLICCTMANMMRSKGRAFTMDDFKINWSPEISKSVGFNDIKIKLMQWATGHNKKVEKEQKQKGK